MPWPHSVFPLNKGHLWAYFALGKKKKKKSSISVFSDLCSSMPAALIVNLTVWQKSATVLPFMKPQTVHLIQTVQNQLSIYFDSARRFRIILRSFPGMVKRY